MRPVGKKCCALVVVATFVACDSSAPQDRVDTASAGTVSFDDVRGSLHAEFSRADSTIINSAKFSDVAARIAARLSDEHIMIGDVEFTQMRSRLFAQQADFSRLDRRFPSIGAYLSQLAAVSGQRQEELDGSLFAGAVRGVAGLYQGTNLEPGLHASLSLAYPGPAPTPTPTPAPLSTNLENILGGVGCFVLISTICLCMNAHTLARLWLRQRQNYLAEHPRPAAGEGMQAAIFQYLLTAGTGSEAGADAEGSLSDHEDVRRRRLSSADASVEAAAFGASAACAAQCPDGVGYPVLPSDARKLRHQQQSQCPAPP